MSWTDERGSSCCTPTRPPTQASAVPGPSPGEVPAQGRGVGSGNLTYRFPFQTDFAKAGASWITFHPDASIHVDRSLQMIRDAGFADVQATDASDWYRRECRREYELIRGDLYPRMVELLGQDGRLTMLQFDNGREQQVLAGYAVGRHLLAQSLETDPLMGGMLVDQDQFIISLAE